MRRTAAALACATLTFATSGAVRSAPAEPPGEIARVSAAGEFTRYPLPTGYRAVSITAGPDGAMWFSELNRAGRNKLGRLTMDGRYSEFAVPGDRYGLFALTAGADGALWFLSGDAVGRLTTSGTYSEHALPRGNHPHGLTAGPDGAIWITQSVGKDRMVASKTLRVVRKIGRISSTGAYSEFALPPGELGPEQITTGADGALWFAQHGWGYECGKIGRITTSGAFREYNVPCATSVIAGPDGAIWFADRNAARIGRLTSSGSVTEYAIPSQIVLGGVTAGPAGTIWYVGGYDGKGTTPGRLGRMTSSGAATEYPLPRTFAAGIATGPDGAIWVAM
jgi:virginiamycin B lyase